MGILKRHRNFCKQRTSSGSSLWTARPWPWIVRFLTHNYSHVLVMGMCQNVHDSISGDKLINIPHHHWINIYQDVTCQQNFWGSSIFPTRIIHSRSAVPPFRSHESWQECPRPTPWWSMVAEWFCWSQNGDVAGKCWKIPHERLGDLLYNGNNFNKHQWE